VHTIGVERFLTELAACIDADFRRWEAFDRSPRIAAHSALGVIELMPTSDGRLRPVFYMRFPVESIT